MRNPLPFAVLLCAALACAALVVHARSPDLVLEVTQMPKRISPDGDGRRERAQIRFFVRESEPHARVEIVGRDLERTRTLDADVALEADRPVVYVWDGRTNSGRPAAPGRYRLRVLLPSRERDVVFPRQLDLGGG